MLKNRKWIASIRRLGSNLRDLSLSPLLLLHILHDQECAPAEMGAEVWCRLLFPACALIPDQPGNWQDTKGRKKRPVPACIQLLSLIWFLLIEWLKKAINKYTSLLDFCKAKQQGSVQNISVILTSMSSRSYYIPGFLIKSKAHLSFCINVQGFSNSTVTLGINETTVWVIYGYKCCMCITYIWIMEVIKKELLASS